MYHSITFGDKNTWDDWHLVPTSRPIFAPPDVKTKTLDIPGADGELNLNELLTGYPVFRNRQGSMEFIVVNGYWSWDVAYSTIMNYLHGKPLKAILEDDPAYFYEGRFSVSDWKSDKSWSLITIDYSVYPYKKELVSSVEEWLWDPFNFESGVIRYTKDLPVNGELTVTIVGSPQRLNPIITASDAMTVEFNGNHYSLVKGAQKVGQILFHEGENTLKFTGTGTVSVDYRGGML